MADRSREKIALFFFTLLVVAGLFIAAAYVIATHSLNIAATHLDDIFGSMDDYSVLVYEGTLEPDRDASAAEGEPEADGEADSDPGTESAVDDLGQSNLSQNGEGSLADEEGTSAGEDAAADHLDPIAALSALAGSPLGADPRESEPIIASDVVDEYRSKGADALELSVAESSQYASGKITTLGALRIGVFSTDDLMPASEVARMIAYFELHDVDVVVAIAPMRNYLRSLEGIDVVVTTADASASSLGSTVDGTFVVQAPERGSVGVVMIAPSTVVSSKVVAS